MLTNITVALYFLLTLTKIRVQSRHRMGSAGLNEDPGPQP